MHRATCKLAQGVREPELLFTRGADISPVPRLSCDVVSESLAESDFQPRGTGGTAATVFSGDILRLEGVSTRSVWPVTSTFTCLLLTSMTRILLRWASLRPFASQFGRIGFVIAWYIISSLRNGGPYSSYPLFSFSLTFRTSSSCVAASA